MRLMLWSPKHSKTDIPGGIMEEAKDGEKGGCCAKGRGCACKALIGLVLVAAGWAGGYFCGRRCGTKVCATPAPAEAPAEPAK